MRGGGGIKNISPCLIVMFGGNVFVVVPEDLAGSNQETSDSALNKLI